jgi:hypothetical protein
MWSLVVDEFSLHVDAINGIVDTVLNVPEVAHEIIHPVLSARNANWRIVFLRSDE